MENNRLKEYRKKKSLTQQELADELNVSRQTISKWENGQSEPDINSITKLSMIFNTSYEEIISWFSDKQTKKHSSIDKVKFLFLYLATIETINLVIFIIFIFFLLYFLKISS
ncbi:helix-turn-helix transcriptional regulator [Enterococcus rivorum]|uniref:HTH cro/C1-type domain-containing protein n=1 Tax=Enterococcus rivorum TaxID=762845 RepID=A0A1E5KS65_9ENTE|nr:helix-turn-helix transcriptional regulator [Enterococcus rivorum]MBP2097363.1 transcriptional regulator with XRE-family HTH domain [Enterococcus rivorum]OEH80714.1 hypothetical protein BCR26_06835 [Enterococcus rivorum]